MNIEHLYSIIDLYIRNEKDNAKINLNIQKVDDKVIFNFNMNQNDIEKTSFAFPVEDVVKEISKILNIYKQDMMIIKEEYLKDKNNPSYQVIFQNGRIISFDGFSILDINRLRNILYNITMYQSELRLDEINDEKQMAYNPNYRLQQAGFTSYGTLLLVALYLTDAFLIALWVFKIIIK